MSGEHEDTLGVLRELHALDAVPRWKCGSGRPLDSPLEFLPRCEVAVRSTALLTVDPGVTDEQ